MPEIQVWAGGATSRYSGPESHRSARISSGLPVTDTDPALEHGITITFSIRRGKGRSRVHLWIAPSSFSELADAMVGASKEATEAAFRSALAGLKRKALKP